MALSKTVANLEYPDSAGHGWVCVSTEVLGRRQLDHLRTRRWRTFLVIRPG